MSRSGATSTRTHASGVAIPVPVVVLTARTVRLVFAALMVTTFLSSLDQSILSTAMPTIVGELDGVEHQGWLMTAYILAIALVMPLYGKFGDLVGRRRPFLLAVALFTLASVGAGLATTFEQLVLWRGVQGLGGGGLIILAQAIIADVVPASERGRYLGPLGAMFGVAAVVGPLLGGVFTQVLDWRWCFWINLPLGVATFVAAWFTLRLPSHRSDRPVDWAGIAQLIVATAGVVLLTSWVGLGEGERLGYDWSDPWLLGTAVVTVGATVGFLLTERRAVDPVLPLHLFRDRTFTVSTLIALVLGVGLFSAMTYLPTYLQMATGAGATESGMLMLPMMVGVGLTTVASGWLMARTGRYKIYPVVGMALSTLALAWMTTLTAQTSMVEFGAMVFSLGAGLGLVLQTIVIAAQNAVDPHEVGIATSTNNFFREIGAAIGVALFATVFTGRLAAHYAERWPQGLPGVEGGIDSLTPGVLARVTAEQRADLGDLFAEALAPSFWFLVPLLVAGLVLACLMREVELSDEAGLVARGEAVVDHGALVEGDPETLEEIAARVAAEEAEEEEESAGSHRHGRAGRHPAAEPGGPSGQAPRRTLGT